MCFCSVVVAPVVLSPEVAGWQVWWGRRQASRRKPQSSRPERQAPQDTPAVALRSAKCHLPVIVSI